ncbi:hypothetical protein LV84_02743 [Algoriphagus ratkowskyi]|uniref:Uncharacterized protein n=1 Tax=Algoriphagus ratkowskyi TaxID=57028 RepID=A0A2W7R881_9BACT|nr:hypothetical protein [Algoriphagus ratkowskyi]PZX54590.1 hypothetical protein LV84_02743 [Algoriphagus ratkowskyi]TXD76905.1 hypothetical protein ESW18_13935 [Algoriphagus ratkowskyi]
MKNFLLIALVALIFISCDKLDEPEILGTYTNTLDGCDSVDDPMFGCGRFITLSAGGVADVLLGGDMISRTTYKIKGEKIKIEKSEQFGLELTFKQLDDGTLREERDKSIWYPADMD